MFTSASREPNGFQNLVTYCLRCSTMLHWNENARPAVVHDGNENMLDCIQSGCWLVFVNLPVQACGFRELNLLRLAFEEAGIPEDIAETAALRLVLANAAPAAA